LYLILVNLFEESFLVCKANPTQENVQIKGGAHFTFNTNTWLMKCSIEPKETPKKKEKKFRNFAFSDNLQK
jgi:hypothetical protein